MKNLSCVLNQLMFGGLFWLAMGVTTIAHAGLLYNYSQLALKDLDQMSKIIQSKITESRKAGGDKVIPLKEALQAVYSRPNEDLMIEKVINPLKAELEEHDSYEASMLALTKEAIGALKNPKAFSPLVQVTYLVFLENLLSEIKPRIQDPFERKLAQMIKAAKVEVSKPAENERRLRVMKPSVSPSETAGILLETEPPAKSDQAVGPQDPNKN